MLNECWSTHTQRGYKMKGGKQVPNCVPKGMKEEIHMSDITNKFTNKVMEAIEISNRKSAGKTITPRISGGNTPIGGVTKMVVSGKGKSTPSGNRPEPTRMISTAPRSLNEPDRFHKDESPSMRASDGYTPADRRKQMADSIRKTRPGNRDPRDREIRSRVIDRLPRDEG